MREFEAGYLWVWDRFLLIYLFRISDITFISSCRNIIS